MTADNLGRLCCSVIEARNVQADSSSGLNFYVKLRVGLSQAKTDVATNSASPKFLKDLRLNVSNPATDTLLVELMQQGQRGDLVIGKESLRVASVVDQGTLVTWLPLTSMDGECAAELCLVMRYLQANSNRPMTPSYAIATREAKQRALDEAGGDPSDLGRAGAKTGVSKALFGDLQQPANGFAPSTPDKSNAATTAASLSPAPALPVITTTASLITATAAGAAALSTSAQSTPTHHRGGPGVGLRPSPLQNNSTARKRRVPPVGQWLGQLGRTVRSHASKVNLPMPAVVAVGSVLGALLYLAKRPAVQAIDMEGPCAVGGCFRPDVYDKYRQRYSTF